MDSADELPPNTLPFSPGCILGLCSSKHPPLPIIFPAHFPSYAQSRTGTSDFTNCVYSILIASRPIC